MTYRVRVVTNDSSAIPNDFRAQFKNIISTSATRMNCWVDADDPEGAWAITEIALDLFGINGYVRSAEPRK